MASENGVNDEYFASYDDLEVHQLMLEDTPRTAGYQQAIQNAGVAGKVVLGQAFLVSITWILTGDFFFLILQNFNFLYFIFFT